MPTSLSSGYGTIQEDEIRVAESDSSSERSGLLRPPRPREGWWSRVKRWLGRRAPEAESIVGAHSPGIFTGPLGTANVASSGIALGNALSQGATQGFGSTAYGNALNNPPTSSTRAATVGSLASGAGDVVGGLRSLYTIGSSASTLLGSDADRGQRALARSQLKSGGLDLATQATDLGAQTESLISTFSHSASTASHAAHVVPFLSLPVSGVVMGRASHRAERARQHSNALHAVIHDPRNPLAHLDEQARFARGQMNKRKWRHRLGAVGAGIGLGGGIALTLGAAGLAASMLTPIGWGLAAAGGLAALGVGAYKMYRHFKKKRGGGERGDERLGSGRERHADRIHQALRSGSAAERKEARRVVRALGLSPRVVRTDGGKEYLKEKLRGW